MSIAQALLAEFEQEAKTTRKFLERLPEDKLSWRPHEKSHTVGELAWHIANLPAGVLQMGLVDQATLPDLNKLWVQPKNVRETLEVLDKSTEFVRRELPKVDDQRMQGMWTLVRDGQTVMSMPRAAMLRFVMLNHWYHHRGQLGVYLRMVGAKVPGSYGPSGDEM